MKMHKLNYISIFMVVILNVCVGQNKWIWSKSNQNGNVVGYSATEKYYARANRDREPTTKRPLPGQPQDEDIDDYSDSNDEITRQHSPYIPQREVGNPLSAGSYNGIGNYPPISAFPGSIANGILVGPGGPTGVIGRPAAQYPGGVAQPAFPAIPVNYPSGYPITQNFAAAGINNNPNYHGFTGLSNVLGQYPYVNGNNPHQFAAAQYPETQFPGAQYPQPPQYTEGYGLAAPNQGFNINPQLNGNFNPNFGFGFDEYQAQVEGKSASVKAIKKKVDDKVTKDLTKQ